MMSRRKRNDRTCGILVLLFLVLSLYFGKQILYGSAPGKNSRAENVFVEISGEVVYPGVYGFQNPPSWVEVLERSGGLDGNMGHPPAVEGGLMYSGAKIHIHLKDQEIRFRKGDMSAFYKLTLALPISVNSETIEGLTAVPRIGQKTAEAIVEEREKRGGFRSLDNLRSVPRIGPSVYEAIRTYITL